MRDRVVAGLFRAARARHDLRQTDVSERCGLSRATIGRHEDGKLEGTTVRALRKHAEALGLRVDLTIRGQTGEILRDEEHAAIGNYVKHELETGGWEVVAEASYSIYGERGRIDLLGYSAARRALLITEQKTDVVDIQDLLGGLDTKERLARTVAAQYGWKPEIVGVLLAITKTDRNVSRVREFPALFARYDVRGPAVRSWLAKPDGPARMLIFIPPAAAGRKVWRNGRQRVRRPPRQQPTARSTARPASALDAGGPGDGRNARGAGAIEPGGAGVGRNARAAGAIDAKLITEGRSAHDAGGTMQPQQ